MDFHHLAPLMDIIPYRHAEALREEAGRGKWALDVGGGTGRVARHLADRFARVVLVDNERAMLKRAQGRRFDLVLADAAHLPFRDSSVDLVLTVDAFHHFPDQQGALRAAHRVLGPHGRLVLEEFDPASWSGAMIERFERLVRFGSTFHTPVELARLAEEAGFSPRIVRHSRRDYALVAQRA